MSAAYVGLCHVQVKCPWLEEINITQEILPQIDICGRVFENTQTS